MSTKIWLNVLLTIFGIALIFYIALTTYCAVMGLNFADGVTSMFSFLTKPDITDVIKDTNVLNIR